MPRQLGMVNAEGAQPPDITVLASQQLSLFSTARSRRAVMLQRKIALRKYVPSTLHQFQSAHVPFLNILMHVTDHHCLYRCALESTHELVDAHVRCLYVAISDDREGDPDADKT